MKNETTTSNNKRRVKANPKYPDLQPTSTSRAINTNFTSRQDDKFIDSISNQHQQQQQRHQQQQLKQYSGRRTNKNATTKVNSNEQRHHQPQHGSSGLTMQFTRTPQQGKRNDSNSNPSYTITNNQCGKQKTQKVPSAVTLPPDSSMSALAANNAVTIQPFGGPTSLANLAQFSGLEIVQPVQTDLNQAKPQQHANIGRTLLANHSSLPSSTSTSSSQQSTSSLSIFGNKMKGNNLMNQHLRTVNLPKTRRENKINTQARANVSNIVQTNNPAINMSLSNISSVQLLNHTSNQDLASDHRHQLTASNSNSPAVGTMSTSQPVSPSSFNLSQQSTTSNNNQYNHKSKSKVGNMSSNNIGKPRVTKKRQQKQQNNDLYQQFTTDNSYYMPQSFIQSQGEVSQASTSSQYNNPYLNIDDITYQDDGGYMDEGQDEAINYNLAGGGGGDAYEVDNDNQLSDATLLKLMSILSNPALTITPISNSTIQRLDDSNNLSSHNNLDEDTINNNNQSSANSNCNDLTFSMPPIEQLDENVHAIIIGDESNDHNVDVSKIVIKSSTNNDLNETSNNITDVNNINEYDRQQTYLHAIKLARTQCDKINNIYAQNELLAPIVSMFDDGKPRANNNLQNKQQEPLTISTSVRNLILQQSNQQQLHQPKESRQPPTISVELLKQTMMEPCSMASANVDDDDNHNDPHLRSIYGQDCASRIPLNMRKLPKAIRVVETLKSVAVSPPPSPKRTPRKKFKSCPHRLLEYERVPKVEINADDQDNQQQQGLPKSQEELLSTLANIKVVDIGERNVYLSEQHAMIESMMSSDDGEDADKDALAIPEPDEIFINRPKKIMSSIDTMIERKKRRRFERISGREEPKMTSYEEQYDDSDAEWDDAGDLASVDQINLIKTQLPLDEPENESKTDHLKSVGLVSRREKNKILLDRSETKYSKVATMFLEPQPEVSKEMSKFANEVLRTQGFNPPPWTVGNASLKRSDLALLEGLNRNSSRIKVAYMNSLGLEKKSKRITLYKVKPITSEESTVTKHQQSQNNYINDLKRKRDQTDDNRVHKKTNRNISNDISHELVGSKKPEQSSSSSNSINNLKSNTRSELERQDYDSTDIQLSRQPGPIARFNINNVQIQPNGILLNSWEDSVDLIALPAENGNSKMTRPFCRDLMEPQSKDDYMKSLGLMAS